MVIFDEFGPEKIMEVYDSRTGLHGFTVIDNTALGPAKGGIRMTPTVSVDEVAKLARTMTWKCAIAGLPFGGGKSGIVADPRNMTPEQKFNIMKAFGQALRPIAPKYYIAAPDMNTAERDMQAFAEGNGSLKSVTGKPVEMGGIPHEFGSTGFGVFHSTIIATKYARIGGKDFTVAIEGFGNVGSFAAKFLSEYGAKIVAVSDSKGAIYNEKGLDYNKLMEVKKTTGAVANYPDGTKMSNEELFLQEVDVLIPSAIPDVINPSNVRKIKAKLVVEAANIPMTEEMEKQLHSAGILVVPDFVANAGGVISSYAEYKGKTKEEMFRLVEKKVRMNTNKVLRRAKKEKIHPRAAGMKIAMEKIKEGMEKREKKSKKEINNEKN